jgi:hypothetical protein
MCSVLFNTVEIHYESCVESSGMLHRLFGILVAKAVKVLTELATEDYDVPATWLQVPFIFITSMLISLCCYRF